MAYVCNIVNLYISQNTWLYLWHKATQCTNFQTLSFGRSHLYFFYNKFGSNILISHHHNINQLFSSKWIVLQLESDISPELFYNIIYIYIYIALIFLLCANVDVLIFVLFLAINHVLDSKIAIAITIHLHLEVKLIIPGLIKMSPFDWSMTRWYKTHVTGW